MNAVRPIRLGSRSTLTSLSLGVLLLFPAVSANSLDAGQAFGISQIIEAISTAVQPFAKRGKSDEAAEAVVEELERILNNRYVEIPEGLTRGQIFELAGAEYTDERELLHCRAQIKATSPPPEMKTRFLADCEPPKPRVTCPACPEPEPVVSVQDLLDCGLRVKKSARSKEAPLGLLWFRPEDASCEAWNLIHDRAVALERKGEIE